MSKEIIYFDNAATTPLSNAVKQKMLEVMEIYGNPSSLHPVGQQARALLEEARRQVALSLGVRNLQNGRLLFTASGSEADNLAIFGTAYAKPRRRGGRIITTDSEHSAVEKTLRALEADGFEVVRISTKNGVLDMQAYADALNDRVFLVTMMAVNNETGAAYELSRAFAMAKAKNPDVVTHTDAVQAYLKIPLTPTSIKADMISISGHKVHAPKGVGALYVSPEAIKRRDLIPTVYGGGQEYGFRSGTENLVGIAALGEAARVGHASFAERVAHLRALREYAIGRLSELEVRVNQPQGACAPHVINITLPDVKSETMLHALSESGICVSQGSACSSRARSVSSSLISFGLTPAEAECSLRLSFGEENTAEQIDLTVNAMREALARLVRIHH